MSRLAFLSPQYDIVVIGGGVHGAAIALEAARLGYEVLVIDKNDFCSQTSANSLKIIHGGLRYLRSGDIQRSRESALELNDLMRLAPHLVKPLPCLMGTGRTFSGSKSAMSLGLWFYDNIVCAGLGKRPRGKSLSVEEANGLAGREAFEGCTGAVLWYDGQVIDSERLVLSYLKTAENAGAHIGNYIEVTGVERGAELHVSLRATDSSEVSCVATKFVIDTASLVEPYPHWNRAVNLVIARRCGTHAVGRKLRYPSADSADRLFFATPLGEFVLVGTWYFRDRPDAAHSIDQAEHRRCIVDAQDLLPDLEISESDVCLIHVGRLPVTDADKPLSLLEKPVIRTLDDAGRIISVSGVKYTTARPTATKTLTKAFGKELVGRAGRLESLYGTPAATSDLENAIKQSLAGRADPQRLQAIGDRLCQQYGAVAADIVHKAATVPDGFEGMPEQNAIRAEIEYCMDVEYCRTVSDFLVRRSGIGSLEIPPVATIQYCAAVMAERLGWTGTRTDAEVEGLQSCYQRVEPDP